MVKLGYKAPIISRLSLSASVLACWVLHQVTRGVTLTLIAGAPPSHPWFWTAIYVALFVVGFWWKPAIATVYPGERVLFQCSAASVLTQHGVQAPSVHGCITTSSLTSLGGSVSCFMSTCVAATQVKCMPLIQLRSICHAYAAVLGSRSLPVPSSD